ALDTRVRAKELTRSERQAAAKEFDNAMKAIEEAQKHENYINGVGRLPNDQWDARCTRRIVIKSNWPQKDIRTLPPWIDHGDIVCTVQQWRTAYEFFPTFYRLASQLRLLWTVAQSQKRQIGTDF
ncbi:hypothetical protein WOLCODRAFT_158783, partial [Wolfiporia cocos MD-104 SS10]